MLLKEKDTQEELVEELSLFREFSDFVSVRTCRAGIDILQEIIQTTDTTTGPATTDHSARRKGAGSAQAC